MSSSGASRAATASMPSFGSTAITEPAEPTRRNAALASTPVPVPMSINRSPTCASTASSIGPAHWANSAGTKNSSYTSAAVVETCPDEALLSELVPILRWSAVTPCL